MKRGFRKEHAILAVAFVLLVAFGITRIKGREDVALTEFSEEVENDVALSDASARDSLPGDESELITSASLVSTAATGSAEKTEGELLESSEVRQRIGIFVDGEVNRPGFYEMEEGQRIQHALDKAGGITDQADMKTVNPAALLQDEMKITVPSKAEAGASNGDASKDDLPADPVVIGTSTSTAAQREKEDGLSASESNSASHSSKKEPSSKININTAGLEELMTLPSIGESKAKKIIAYRDQTPFQSIEEIKNVSGIGDKIYEKIAPWISIQ